MSVALAWQRAARCVQGHEPAAAQARPGEDPERQVNRAQANDAARLVACRIEVTPCALHATPSRVFSEVQRSNLAQGTGMRESSTTGPRAMPRHARRGGCTRHGCLLVMRSRVGYPVRRNGRAGRTQRGGNPLHATTYFRSPEARQLFVPRYGSEPRPRRRSRPLRECSVFVSQPCRRDCAACDIGRHACSSRCSCLGRRRDGGKPSPLIVAVELSSCRCSALPMCGRVLAADLRGESHGTFASIPTLPGHG